MTEHNEFSYAKSLKNTLTQNDIMRMAHGVIQANVSKPEVVKENISALRQQLAVKKLPQLVKTKSRFEALEQANKYMLAGDMVKARVALKMVGA